jgi:hypothetical protein
MSQILTRHEAAQYLRVSIRSIVAMHLRHFIKTFGVNFPAYTLALAKLQEHVNRRVKQKGIRKRLLNPTTIRKEQPPTYTSKESATARGKDPAARIMNSNCLLVTIYRRFGIDTRQVHEDKTGRPIPILTDGTPIEELF